MLKHKNKKGLPSPRRRVIGNYKHPIGAIVFGCGLTLSNAQYLIYSYEQAQKLLPSNIGIDFKDQVTYGYVVISDIGGYTCDEFMNLPYKKVYYCSEEDDIAVYLNCDARTSGHDLCEDGKVAEFPDYMRLAGFLSCEALKASMYALKGCDMSYYEAACANTTDWNLGESLIYATTIPSKIQEQANYTKEVVSVGYICSEWSDLLNSSVPMFFEEFEEKTNAGECTKVKVVFSDINCDGSAAQSSLCSSDDD